MANYNKTRIQRIAAISGLLCCTAIIMLAVYLAYLKTYSEAEQLLNKTVTRIQDNAQQFFQETLDALKPLIKTKDICSANTENTLKKVVLNDTEISIAYINTPQKQCATIKPFQYDLLSKIKNSQQQLAGPLHINDIVQNAYAIRLKQNNIELGAVFPLYVLKAHINKFTQDPFLNIQLFNNKQNLFYENIHHKKEILISATSKLPPLDNVHLKVSLAKQWLWQKLMPHILMAVMIAAFICGLFLMALYRFTKHKLSIESELKTALTRKQFVPYYQPVIDLATHHCRGVECLVRWQINQHEILYPDTFIPAAEKAQLIKPMTEQLIHKIFLDLGDYLKQNPDFHIAINLTPQNFNDRDVLDLVVKLCQKYQVNNQQIIFEITEQELMDESSDFAISLMQEMRSLGFSLALDDFGTGYSSINYLRKFPFNYLKIDKLFVMAIGSAAITAQLADSIIDLADNLNLKIIAEGIETSEHHAYLKQRQVNFGQGWLYSKALSVTQLKKYLSNM